MFLLDRRSLLRRAGAGAATLLAPKAALAASGATVFTSDEAGTLVDSIVRLWASAPPCWSPRS